MTIVGETANVFGRVEGEICRPLIVWISGGGQLEGVVVAQELTVGGRFKGTIHANRVTLATSAVVEGEIFLPLVGRRRERLVRGVVRPEENLILSWTTTHVNDGPSLLPASIQEVPEQEGGQNVSQIQRQLSVRTPTTGTAVAKSSQCKSRGVRYNRRFLELFHRSLE